MNSMPYALVIQGPDMASILRWMGRAQYSKSQEAHVTTQLFADQSVGTAIRAKDTRPKPESRLHGGIAAFVITFQSVLVLAHWFVSWTWTAFQTTDPVSATTLKAALTVLSSTFVTVSLLAFRYYNASVRVFYRIAAIWLVNAPGTSSELSPVGIRSRPTIV